MSCTGKTVEARDGSVKGTVKMHFTVEEPLDETPGYVPHRKYAPPVEKVYVQTGQVNEDRAVLPLSDVIVK